MKLMSLTEHFGYLEVIRSGKAEKMDIDNALPESLLGNVQIAAAGMEQVRALLGHPIAVNSWYRCPALNVVVNGSKTSAHMQGYAIDFICPEFGTPAQIVFEIVASGIKFDQCIEEGNWVHISFDPRLRQQLMTAHFDSSGHATYTKGLTWT